MCRVAGSALERFKKLVAAQVRHVRVDKNQVWRGIQNKVLAYNAVLSEQDRSRHFANAASRI
jgi:hypothetical protein